MGLTSRIILLFFVCCQLSELVGAGETECSPFNDMVWKKEKCRQCQPCKVGRGRNFTQTDERMEKLDITKCLPCEKCPDGSFNDRQGFKSSCRPCTSDKCYKLNREIQRQCTSTSDQICGSCVHGYNDDFHRDHKQPCYRDPTSSSAVASATTQLPNTVSPMLLKTPQQDNINVGQVRGQNGWEQYDPKYLAIGVVPTFCIVFTAVMVFICRRRQQSGARCSDRNIENGACAAGCSMTTLGSSITEFSALMEQPQTDGPLQGGKKHKKVPLNARSNVRGELHSYSGPTQNGMHVSDQPTDHRATSEEPAEKCGCNVTQCGPACQASSIDEHVVKKSDSMLNEIVCKICHGPDQFFTTLEIARSEIYNLEDNRIRAPDKYSQREFIRSVLSRWVEVNGKNATYGRIRKALCTGGFHRINDELFSRQ